MTTYIIDTETTGNVEPQVIELAWTAVDAGLELEITQAVSSKRFKPSRPIELGAMATHHIQMDALLDCPSHETACLPPDTEYIIGHNVDYDWKALGSPDVKRICTLALAQNLLPTLDTHKLGALIYHFVPSRARELTRHAHEATTDVELCGLVLEHLLSILEKRGLSVGSSERLWQISEAARIPKIMQFGKYKGEPIELVPAGWVTWYLKQTNTDPYLVRAFAAVRKARR